MSSAYAATSRVRQSDSGLAIAFTCWYAPSGKKNGIAASGLSVTIACHSAPEPAMNRALEADGLSGVWGRNCGSGSVVVVGAGPVVGGSVGGTVGATIGAVVPVVTACDGESPPRVSTTTPTPTSTTITAATTSTMRRRRARRRRRAPRGDAAPVTGGTV